MSFTLCTSGSIVRRAGLNVNSTIAASGSALADYCDQAEGEVCARTRRNWVSSYSTVAADLKPALAKATAALAAMNVVSYDMSGFTSRAEAQTMLNVLRDESDKIITDIKDFKSNELKNPD